MFNIIVIIVVIVFLIYILLNYKIRNKDKFDKSAYKYVGNENIDVILDTVLNENNDQFFSFRMPEKQYTYIIPAIKIYDNSKEIDCILGNMDIYRNKYNNISMMIGSDSMFAEVYNNIEFEGDKYNCCYLEKEDIDILRNIKEDSVVKLSFTSIRNTEEYEIGILEKRLIIAIIEKLDELLELGYRI